MNWKEVIVEINNQAVEAVSSIMNELGSNVLLNEQDKRSRISAYYLMTISSFN